MQGSCHSPEIVSSEKVLSKNLVLLYHCAPNPLLLFWRLEEPMTSDKRYAYLLLAVLIFMGSILGVGAGFYRDHSVPVIVHAPPAPVHDIQSELLTKQYVAALDVARVFGRAPGCADAEPKLITAVAVEALNDSVDPRILAATLAVESGCDPMAISHSGAIGLTQINVKVWKSKFDFTRVNLFNPDENLHVGATILSDLIKQYGTINGLRRYNGLDIQSPAYDSGYVSRIITLAGRR